MDHPIVSPQEWLTARLKLLEQEKELTRRSDELARLRQALPWVRLDKQYSFQIDQGRATLVDLFQGCSQLLIYHFMFGPDYTAGCPSCSSIADGFNGIAVHLAHHDVMFWAVSRAPLPKLQAYKQRMGWTFPWASSFESDFNFDFAASFTPQQQIQGGATYNFRAFPTPGWKSALQATRGTPAEHAAACGTNTPTYLRELPGMSAFALEDGVVYHTYSAYERGLDALWGMYPWLDRAPKGRNEKGPWLHRHDEYEATSPQSDHPRH